jgi:hypothetical protein
MPKTAPRNRLPRGSLAEPACQAVRYMILRGEQSFVPPPRAAPGA